MKILYIISLLFLITLKISAQTALNTDGLNNLNNVFLVALTEYCADLDSNQTQVVYVKKEYPIGDIWPTKILSYKIEYLSDQKDYRRVIKEHNGHATIVGICPFEFRDGKFSVGVVPFSATYSKKLIHLGNGGGLSVYFDYNPSLKGMIYTSKEWGGI